MLNRLSIIFIPILYFIRLALFFLLLVVIVGIVAPYVKDIYSHALFKPILDVDHIINLRVKSIIPTVVLGYDAARIIVIIAILMVLSATRSALDYFKTKRARAKFHQEFLQLKATYQTEEQKTKLSAFEDKMQSRNLTSAKDRRELLTEFVQIKKELEKIGRNLAFLAIDVVDSTGMKNNEDPNVVEHDFLEYHNYVEAKFKECGYIKASWTPDGVMACFNSIKDALKAAQSILKDLDDFNKQTKVMKQDFQIRCGINAGFVYYDDTIPLEQFSDRIIDIAGHMQKHASPNSILIAKEIIEPVKDIENFIPSKRLVDGLQVYKWNMK